MSSFVLIETERNLIKKAARALSHFQTLRESAIFRIVDPDPALVRRVAESIELKDVPIVAGAIAAYTAVSATYGRKHLLSQAGTIFRLFKITVDSPDNIVASMAI